MVKCLCEMIKGHFMYDKFNCTVDISQYWAQVSRFKVKASQDRQRGALTATVATTPGNNDLIG